MIGQQRSPKDRQAVRMRCLQRAAGVAVVFRRSRRARPESLKAL
jgi:hypothetical protein